MAMSRKITHPKPRAPITPYFWESWLGASRYAKRLAAVERENQELREQSDMRALLAASEDHKRLEDMVQVREHSIDETGGMRDITRFSARLTAALFPSSDDLLRPALVPSSDDLLRLARDGEVVSWRGRCWIIDSIDVPMDFSLSVTEKTYDILLTGVVNPKRTRENG